MNAKPAGTLELLAVALAAVGLVVSLPSHGMLAYLASAVSAAIPVLAWVYARFRAPQHVFAIVGAACGLAALPAFHGVSALAFGSGLLQLVGIAAMLVVVLITLPTALVSLVLHKDTIGEHYVYVLLCGLLWAVVFGGLGHLLDRRRQRARQSPAGRAS